MITLSESIKTLEQAGFQLVGEEASVREGVFFESPDKKFQGRVKANERYQYLPHSSLMFTYKTLSKSKVSINRELSQSLRSEAPFELTLKWLREYLEERSVQFE